MKYINMKSALMLCFFALAGVASSAHAIPVIITFDDTGGVEDGSTYTVGEYVFSGVKLGTAQCQDGTCINFRAQDNFTLTRTDEEKFTLDSFWIQFQSDEPILDVNGAKFCTDDALCSGLGFNAGWNSQTGELAENGIDYSLMAAFTFTFDNTRNRGNIRLDTFNLTCAECDNGTPVPEPGTLGLLGLGLLGLAMNRRRKV